LRPGLRIGGFEGAGALADFIMTAEAEPIGHVLDVLAQG